MWHTHWCVLSTHTNHCGVNNIFENIFLLSTMKSVYLVLALRLINAYRYTITVSNAKDLIEKDTDFLWMTNDNDAYVIIEGYNDNDKLITTEQTKTIDCSDAPEWNEKFAFDDNDKDGPYKKWKFLLYDDDSIGGIDDTLWTKADFLGETDYIYADDINDCVEYFSEDMQVVIDNKDTGGILFVEVVEDGCEYPVIKDKDKDKGSGGGGKGNK
eukprot:236319_1